MKIELPKDWTQVTLKQFQAIQAMLKDEGDVYQKNTELISILSGKDIKDIEKIALKGYTQILKVLEFINEPIENKLTNTFKLNGKKYKVISDIYKINGGQYITLQHLLKDSESVIDNLNQIMAVFAVPYERKWWGWKRGKYDSDQHEEIAEEMLQLPISIAQPLSTFFFENWKRSVERMLASSEKQTREIEKELIKELKLIQANTDGSPPSIPWLITMLQSGTISSIFSSGSSSILSHFRKLNKLTTTK
jgi:hypothetical protein